MESGVKNDSDRGASTSETSAKLDKPSLKIKISVKKLSGKQQGGLDSNVHTTLDGNTTSKQGTDSHSADANLTVPSSTLDANMVCIASVESSQQSMSSPTNQTQEDDSILIDVPSALESKKTEPTQRNTRARTSSFDLREDLKFMNHATSTDDKNRLPVANSIHHSQDIHTFESSAVMSSRQPNTGSESKEARDSSNTNILTSSFLDSLNEDERRVRTRHLPAAAGFHRLHKKEVNSDLSMVKNMLKTMVPNQPKIRRVVSDEAGQKNGDKMDIDDDDVMAASDEDNSSDTSGAAFKGISKSNSVMDDTRMDFAISSFSSPYPVSNFVLTELDQISSSTLDYRDLLLRSPQVVESLTTFNPPRPPESVGLKKKHRLLRWEKNPDDIEKDLKNYRKTVRRTKEELQKTIRERERMETVGCFIRTLFMNHLHGMKMENEYLTQELNQLQNEAYRLLDRDTRIKTRHKGSTNKSHGAMKDVMTFITSHRKSIFSPVMTSHRCGMPFTSGSCLPQDLLVQGDVVLTPYGKGTVVKIIGPQIYYEFQKGFSMAMDPNGDYVFNVIPTRVCVRLSYGTAYLTPLIIKPIDDLSTFSADKMAKRWTAMLESASEFSSLGDPTFHSSHGMKLEADDDDTTTQAVNGNDKNHNTEPARDDLQIGLLVNHPIDSLFQEVEKVFESDRCVLAQVRFIILIYISFPKKILFPLIF